jgi:hypothetical protein
MTAAQSEQSTAPETTEELLEDIEQTRADLAQTAQALSDKFDVKQRAGAAVGTVQNRVQEVPARAAAQWQRDPVPIVAAGATFVFALLVMARTGRR